MSLDVSQEAARLEWVLSTLPAELTEQFETDWQKWRNLYKTPVSTRDLLMLRTAFVCGWLSARSATAAPYNEFHDQRGPDEDREILEALGHEQPRLCSVCDEPQFRTRSGWGCTNGHGGAPPKTEQTKEKKTR